MNKEPAVQAKYTLTVCLTIIFCVLAFCVWLPKHIQEKANLVLNKQGPVDKYAHLDDTQISQELVDYIKQQHGEVASETDVLDEEDLTSQFTTAASEDFQDSADKILQNRFKYPELNSETGVHDGFEVPEGLTDVVRFWSHIFGIYDKNQVVFYNSDFVGVVYSVLDFSDINPDVKGAHAIKKQLIYEERKRIVGILKKVSDRIKHVSKQGKHEKVMIDFSGLNDEEKRIAKMLAKQADIVDLSEKGLLKKLAYRKGFSHRIKQAIRVSGRYMDEMQRVFRERGLPEELTMIPFIESAFDLDAYSRAGAAGIWQFISATGKRYLRIDEYVDERYDPILAAYAAATHLSNEYELLGTWPMTINAYNTGPGRLQQAVRKLKTTDITTIIKKFNGSGYGFDSRNYYPEFLAALDVYKNQEYYFGDLKPFKPEEYVYVAMPSPMNLKRLSSLAGVSIDEIAKMNIGLKPAVLQGQLELPKGYLVKVKPNSKENMLLAMQELFDAVRYASHHVVMEGDTLRKIARRYDLKTKQLAMHNNMLTNEKLKPGTIVQLPSRADDVEFTLETGDSELVIPDKLHTPIF